LLGLASMCGGWPDEPFLDVGLVGCGSEEARKQMVIGLRPSWTMALLGFFYLHLNRPPPEKQIVAMAAAECCLPKLRKIRQRRRVYICAPPTLTGAVAPSRLNVDPPMS
jgi:hypothetical protein